MGYHFSTDEVFEMAKQIEINGAKFYREAAENIEGEAEKAFLITLAEMEDNHEKTFEKMHEEFKALAKNQEIFDPDGQALLHLKAMADTKIFFKKEAPGKEMENILHSAIRAEQDSVIFYLGMCELVSDDLGKSRVDAIIKEELEHIRILLMKLTELGQ